MNSLLMVAKYLTDNSETLAKKIVDDILRRLGVDFPEAEKKYYYDVYIEFIELLAEAITLGEDRVPQRFIEMSKENGERQAALKGNISGMIGRYPSIRLGFIEQMTKIAIEHKLSVEDTVTLNKTVSHMLDISVTETILAFEREKDTVLDKREREINKQQKAINELSAPIVPIQDGIAILPLIGEVDSYRVEYFLNKVLPDIPRLNIKYLIIDFSGIVTIDTNVASHLFRVHDILRLLGIHVVFTGIRPDLATQVINGGIDFSMIETYANVMKAIENMKNRF
ncbi:STAS domain-containing protein [Bacillus sp. V5-8f]|uniref:STAS domain-containing protein n=1 Tax=Bacillus sp. V5-8f TaxID=2053044 RepID=UPI000C788286|nr:STAS domain-containing protein [Bacillus sp. V5-8f]PLT31988.1 anti-anti-sigma factor [Bacillus sp. V5-8f]